MNKFGFLSTAVAITFIGCAGIAKQVAETPAEVSVPTKATVVKRDTLINANERYSYALGINVAQSLKDVFELGLNADIMNQGLKDKLDTNASPLMTDIEAEAALQALILELQTKRDAKEKENAQKAIEDQKAFLEQNKTQEGVITTASGLQYKITQNAKGIAPTKNDKVKVHYKGSLLDGKQFDSSYDRGEPLEFPVSAVIEGWQELLLNLKTGMKAIAWIPSELGYGTEGAPPVIPSNALLIFEVELLEVVQANKTPADTLLPIDSVQSDSANAITSKDVDSKDAINKESVSKENAINDNAKQNEPEKATIKEAETKK